MICCCTKGAGAGRFFSHFAKRFRKRYEKHGFDQTQKQMIEGLERVGFKDASLLEIGCGVGFLHQSLLEMGASSATGIELSDTMLDEASKRAQEHGLETRTDYHMGDFVSMGDTLPSADITLMDRVICCYPDADAMVHCSLEKTGRAYVLTIPRNLWYIRLGMAALNFMLLLVRSEFRGYIHNPELIDHWIIQKNYTRQYENTTAVWLTRVYVTG